MNKVAKQVQQYFEHDPNVELAFLFGSAAAGKQTKESDIDIGVYLKDRATEASLWRKTQHSLPREVDLVVLNDAPATLISNIFKNGIPLTIKNKRKYWQLYLTKSLEAEDFEDFAVSYWKISKRSRSLSPEDKTRLLERLDFLQSEMRELPEMRAITSVQYEQDKLQRRNLERWAENILNALIDIAKIIIASQKKEMPKTYEAALSAFGVFAGLSKIESEKFAGLARLRNLLTHEYLDILFEKIQEFIHEFPKFYGKIAKPIEKYTEERK
ncbi:DUF86 domain-containing protein [Candidatus Woesearchaeota archaeon]|nr:DUF86 domain-containing protein [Candidatus Woesearchaeota archaeon]